MLWNYLLYKTYYNDIVWRDLLKVREELAEIWRDSVSVISSYIGMKLKLEIVMMYSVFFAGNFIHEHIFEEQVLAHLQKAEPVYI